jgi:hypothetical protein
MAWLKSRAAKDMLSAGIGRVGVVLRSPIRFPDTASAEEEPIVPSLDPAHAGDRAPCLAVVQALPLSSEEAVSPCLPSMPPSVVEEAFRSLGPAWVATPSVGHRRVARTNVPSTQCAPRSSFAASAARLTMCHWHILEKPRHETVGAAGSLP